MRVLITGASGFVGAAVVRHLAQVAAVRVRTAVRGHVSVPPGVEVRRFGGLSPETDWQELVRDVAVIVHAAGRVHVVRDRSIDPLAEFRAVNVAGTLSFARQAARSGVRRFVFLSSIKVNGEQTPAGRSFTADSPPSPVDPYGLSKLEAENALLALARETGMEVVVIRPVLVYGPGVKANFRAMMRAVYLGIPLPLGAINNQRSLVALDNLVDLIAGCLWHRAAAGQTFLVSDGEDLSTPELLRRIADAMGKSARLIPVPIALLRGVATMVGKRPVLRRVCGSLTVDITKTRDLLDWAPPVSVDEALRRTVEAFLGEERHS